MSLAPKFTKENAREMQRRGQEARKRRKAEREAEIKRLQQFEAENTTDPARIARTKMQLAQLDEMIDDALAKKKPQIFLKLMAAKERLWRLVEAKPKAGKPTRPPSRANFQVTDAAPGEV